METLIVTLQSFQLRFKEKVLNNQHPRQLSRAGDTGIEEQDGGWMGGARVFSLDTNTYSRLHSGISGSPKTIWNKWNNKWGLAEVEHCGQLFFFSSITSVCVKIITRRSLFFTFSGLFLLSSLWWEGCKLCLLSLRLWLLVYMSLCGATLFQEVIPVVS